MTATTRVIHLKPTAENVLRFWKLGYDTKDISIFLGVDESVIYNMLAKLNDPGGLE